MILRRTCSTAIVLLAFASTPSIASAAPGEPSFTSSTMSVTNLDRSGAVVAGDRLQYTVSIVNDGEDAAIGTVLVDTLPVGAEYVAGSIRITAGPNSGPCTDQPGDDLADYDGSTNRVTVRLGVGANATNGGALTIGQSTTVVFEVRIPVGTLGMVSNQASIDAVDLAGGGTVHALTDGSPAPGVQTTDVMVDACATNAQCGAPTPFCDIGASPKVCVACIDGSGCSGLTQDCSPQRVCVCVPRGAEVCNSVDDDCNGVMDDVVGVGDSCSVGTGECESTGTMTCFGDGGGPRCDASPGAPGVEVCNGLDDDCDGATDEGCGDVDAGPDETDAGIQDAGAADAGESSGDVDGGPIRGGSSGCGCSVVGAPTSSRAALVAMSGLLVLAFARRRRSAR